jgi:hypothetical protein
VKKYATATFALFLLGLSALLYYGHYLIFRDARHIFIYLLGDIAFVPVSVLLVTLVLEHLLESRQKETLLQKLNMVLGTFFSEVGNPLLKHLDFLRTNNPGLCDRLRLKSEGTPKNLAAAKIFVKNFTYRVDSKRADLEKLRDFLAQKRGFLLILLENPNLLEHDKITDMLWAIFHLTEELMARKDLKTLSPADEEHISGDIKRAYIQLVSEWLEYMHHLKNDYPYLFSLAARLNPFDPQSRAEIS